MRLSCAERMPSDRKFGAQIPSARAEPQLAGVMEPIAAPAPAETQAAPGGVGVKELPPDPEVLKEHVTNWNLSADVAVCSRALRMTNY